MNEKKRRETQAALSAAIHTLLEAIPPSAFGAFHPHEGEESNPVPLEEVRLLLAGEMMASAYLLLEKKVAPRDVVLNTWDLIATMTEVISVEHLAELLPDGKSALRGAAWKIPDKRAKSEVAKTAPKKAAPKKAAPKKAAPKKAAPQTAKAKAAKQR